MTLDPRVPGHRDASSVATLLAQYGSVAGAIAAMEARVQQQPAAADPRWSLFQWLCVIGDWPRALRQLQVAAQLAPDFAATALAYREFIQAEAFRQEVFTGRREPGFLLPAPPWMARLQEALAYAQAGDSAAADASRERALSEAPASPGTHDGSCFGWITDTDTRLGPTCEIVTAGRYAWLPFAQMRKLELAEPAGLLDLVWRPACITLADGTVSRGFVPVRYPGSEQGSDAIRLARETNWTEAGETGVIALGQKTWMTDAGDVAFLDVNTLILGEAHA